MGNLTISSMSENHVDDLLAIESSSFRNPWGKISFLNELTHEFSFNFVLSKKIDFQDQIVAYACMRKIMDEIHIIKIAVNPAFRKRGIAYRFLKDCINNVSQYSIRSAFLEVRPSNSAGLNLYRKLGFDTIGKRPKYYLDTGEDAIIMKKLL